MRSTTIYQGIVRDGQIVLQGEGTKSPLPEGTLVEVHLLETEHNTVEEDHWRRRSEESWATIAWGAN